MKTEIAVPLLAIGIYLTYTFFKDKKDEANKSRPDAPKDPSRSPAVAAAESTVSMVKTGFDTAYTFASDVKNTVESGIGGIFGTASDFIESVDDKLKYQIYNPEGVAAKVAEKIDNTVFQPVRETLMGDHSVPLAATAVIKDTGSVISSFVSNVAKGQVELPKEVQAIVPPGTPIAVVSGQVIRKESAAELQGTEVAYAKKQEYTRKSGNLTVTYNPTLLSKLGKTG